MSIWTDLKSKVSTLSQGLATEVGKFKNQGFLDAVTAGCALVAAADGHIDGIEKQKMHKFVQNSDALKVFDTTAIIKSFGKAADKIEFDYDIGKAEALATVAKLRGKPESRLLVRVCIAIGGSDGNFDDDEKAIVRSICGELGLSPAEFDL